MDRRWRTGEPANLEAAALDALAWLRVLECRFPANVIDRDENLSRLRDCIAQLEKQVGQTRKEG